MPICCPFVVVVTYFIATLASDQVLFARPDFKRRRDFEDDW